MGENSNPWQFGTGTKDVASFVSSFELPELPNDLNENLRKTIIDALGAITAGHTIHETSLVVDYVSDVYSKGNVTILDGNGKEIQAEGAVLANGMAANALDIDEGHLEADGHPAAIIVPVALAVAEEQDATIKEFLESVLVGYEIAVRAGKARPNVTGYHAGTGSWGPIGSAASAAKLRDLNQAEIENALGIADFNSPITPIIRSVANPGSGLTKDGIAWGGYVGINAVEFAERGLNGSGTIFDHQKVTAHEDLGSEFWISNQYFKPYPACRWTHAGLDAVRDLYRNHSIDPESIEKVEVYTFDYANQLSTRNPSTADEAEYSYPYVLAVALMTGQVTTGDLHRDALSNEEIADMMERIEFHFDPDLEERYEDAWLSRIEIRTADETYESGVTYPRGSVERPLSTDEFDEKQARLFEHHPSSQAYSQLLETIDSPDDPVREIIKIWQ